MVQSDNQLTVVDLDGTYLQANSLHIYIRCGLRQMLRRVRILSWLWAMILLLARQLRLIKHTTMKFAICTMIDPEDTILRKNFVAQATTKINKQVSERIATCAHVLLATAAPDTYIPWIWDGDYLATAMNNNPERIECRGEEKLRRVQDYAQKFKLSLLLTDHSDDLPLMHKFEQVVLVKPSTHSLAIIKAAGIKNPEILN